MNSILLVVNCCFVHIIIFNLIFGTDDVSAQIELQPALKFNGGGHINHSIFWQNLTPESTKPEG